MSEERAKNAWQRFQKPSQFEQVLDAANLIEERQRKERKTLAPPWRSILATTGQSKRAIITLDELLRDPDAYELAFERLSHNLQIALAAEQKGTSITEIASKNKWDLKQARQYLHTAHFRMRKLLRTKTESPSKESS